LGFDFFSRKQHELKAAAYCCAGLIAFFSAGFLSKCYGAPCYGTKMPERNKFFAGVQTHVLLERELAQSYGTMRSAQNFVLLSYGAADWFSIDLKGGSGVVKQRPLDRSEVDYPTFLAGGYGFRLRLMERAGFKSVLGFQHISAHPFSIHLNGRRDKAVLDDWQWSLLGSYDIARFTPYLGAKWSRADFIHWQGDDRRRDKSVIGRSIGFVLGTDFSCADNIWFNLEGQFIDGQALAWSINYSF